MSRAGPASESACLDWSRSEMVDAPVRKSGHTTFRWDMLLRPGPFDWRAVAPLRAVRAAVDVIVPLLTGRATGRLDFGAFAALGTFSAGFSSFQGVTRTGSSQLAASTATVG
jgi:hypothetical protein